MFARSAVSLVALAASMLALSVAPALAKHHKHHHKPAHMKLVGCALGSLLSEAGGFSHLEQQGTTCTQARSVADPDQATPSGWSCKSKHRPGGTYGFNAVTCKDGAAEVKWDEAA
jgi:hypothetical protein